MCEDTFQCLVIRGRTHLHLHFNKTSSPLQNVDFVVTNVNFDFRITEDSKARTVIVLLVSKRCTGLAI